MSMNKPPLSDGPRIPHAVLRPSASADATPRAALGVCAGINNDNNMSGFSISAPYSKEALIS